MSALIKENYCDLLYSVFSQCSEVMDKKSTVYVRTDTRDFTYETTFAILEECFPYHELITKKNGYGARTQTEIMGNSSTEIGEIDIILVRR